MHDFGEKTELHALRQEWATRLAALHDRHSEEEQGFRDDYRDLLANRDLTESEIEREVFALIREATPLLNEYGPGVDTDDDV